MTGVALTPSRYIMRRGPRAWFIKPRCGGSCTNRWAWSGGPIDPHTLGMAEVAGVAGETIRAWSQRSTQLRQWASAIWSSTRRLASLRRSWRPRRKPLVRPSPSTCPGRSDGIGGLPTNAASRSMKPPKSRPGDSGNPLASTRSTVARHAAAEIDKPAFTRADLVEAVGARLPVAIDGAPGTPRTLIEAIADRIGVRISEPRQAHEREGHERFTTAPIIAEEAAVLELMGARDERGVIIEAAIDTAGLSPDQGGAITAIATSPCLIQLLSAPAGAGKTTSLKALRAAAHRGGKPRVVVLAPTGKAVDVAVREGAGDAGYTVAKAVKHLREHALKIDARTLVVVDEAAMVGTPQLRELLTASTAAGAKTVLVGDAHQLAPVKARGGMFAQLVEDLPWAQRLSEVWRMRDPAERTASLALRNGGPKPIRRAVEWYRTHDRLHTGDALTMAQHPGADKPAVLAAIAAAAHHSQRGILALPATAKARDYSTTHPLRRHHHHPRDRPCQPRKRALEPPPGQPGHRRRRRPPTSRPTALPDRKRRPHQHHTAAGHQQRRQPPTRTHPDRHAQRKPALGTTTRHSRRPPPQAARHRAATRRTPPRQHRSGPGQRRRHRPAPPSRPTPLPDGMLSWPFPSGSYRSVES